MSVEGKVFMAYYSIWKLLLLELIAAGLAILPLLPGFGRGLRYTAAFYGTLSPLRVAACLLLGLLGIIVLPLLMRALSRRPALELSQDDVTICTWACRTFRRRDIAKINGPDWQGNIVIELRNSRRRLGVPTFVYQDAAAAIEKLKEGSE